MLSDRPREDDDERPEFLDGALEDEWRSDEALDAYREQLRDPARRAAAAALYRADLDRRRPAHDLILIYGTVALAVCCALLIIGLWVVT